MLKPSSVAVAIVYMLHTSPAIAEGYKLFEQSVSSMGNAYAGRGAQINDASLVYSNPAALTHLEGQHFSGGFNIVDAKTHYQDAFASNSLGTSVVGRSSGQNSLFEMIPFGFFSDELTDRLNYGVGFYVPFGLSSDYDNNWAGRYFADETAIQVLALQGSLAYQLHRDWSLGLGLSLNHAEGTLSKYKDHQGLCESGRQLNAIFQQDVFNSAYCESHYEVSGDDVAAGFSLGLHGQPFAHVKLALVYHSELRFTLQGDSTLTNAPITGAQVAHSPHYLIVAPQLPALDKTTGKLAATPLLREASQLALTTPANLMLSLDHQFAPNWSWQASLNWTGWSVFQTIEIISQDAQPSLSLSASQPQNLAKPGYIGYIPEYWRDSWSAALGLTWQFQSDLRLKTGFASDENPIAQSHKTARVPTADRLWWTLGATWQFDNRWSFDMAYGYMWMKSLNIHEHEYNAYDQRIYQSQLQATFKNHAQLFGLQINYHF